MPLSPTAGLPESDRTAQRPSQSHRPAASGLTEALVNPSSEFGLGFLSGGGILSASAKLVMDSVGANGIAIAYATDGTVVCRASCGENAPPVGTPVNLNSGIGAQCLRDGKTVTCADTETDPRVNTAVCRQIGVRSMLAVPLRRGSKVLGVAQVFYAEPNGFSDASVAELESSADLFVSCLPAGTDVEENAPSPSVSDEDSLTDDPAPYSTSGAAEHISLAKLSLETPDATLSLVSEASAQNAVKQISKDPAQAPEAEHLPIKTDKESAANPPLQKLSSDKSASQPLQGLNTRSAILAGTTAPAIFAQIEEPPWWKRPTLVAVALAVMCALLWIGFDKSSRSLLSAKGTQSANAVGEEQVDGSALTSQTPLAQLLKQARSGDSQAQLLLAQQYEKGNGIAKNLTKANAWYIVAAEAGSEPAKQAIRALTSKLSPSQLAAVRFEVGRMYANGIGVRHRDYVAAYAWLILAEAAGEPRAKAEQKALARSMRNQEILLARTRAAGWLKARGYRTELAKAAPTSPQR